MNFPPNPLIFGHRYGSRRFRSVHPVLCGSLLALAASNIPTFAAGFLQLTSPLDYQVIQRANAAIGTIVVRGQWSEASSANWTLESRLITGQQTNDWQRLPASIAAGRFVGQLTAPAGGWYRLEVRAQSGQEAAAEAQVEHVGVGEVLVVAGQSNSANHGEEKQSTRTGRVAAFDGRHWRLAQDPQPGASGDGGSFLPPLGDALAMRLQVPIGFIACGIGATSVREWLPKGATFPHPPTLEGRVTRLPDGRWVSDGQAFATLLNRLQQQGPHGVRAVLWHQGESDANQKDASRTLAGPLYREYLERIIRDTRTGAGWEVPWFVAQVSYHVPGDESSPDIRAAQASLWKDGIALEGPDSDALKREWRDSGGQGVHFSGPGLREHAQRWAERLLPWLETTALK